MNKDAKILLERLIERTASLLERHTADRRALQTRIAELEAKARNRVCCPVTTWPPGEVVTGYDCLKARDGHVFGFRRGPDTPAMIYATCVACGQAHHHLFPNA